MPVRLILALMLVPLPACSIDPTTELRRRAEQGDAVAQLTLGVLYEDGDGVAQDYEEAAKW